VQAAATFAETAGNITIFQTGYSMYYTAQTVLRHEREISKCREVKLDFAEIDKCKPVLLGLSLAGNLWREFQTKLIVR
jgi:hypothetical protein